MSQLTVGEMQPERSKEYIQMFFMPSKKVVNPKSNFRYTVGSPLVRENLPQDLLDRATHVNFDDMHKGGLISESIIDFVHLIMLRDRDFSIFFRLESNLKYFLRLRHL